MSSITPYIAQMGQNAGAGILAGANAFREQQMLRDRMALDRQRLESQNAFEQQRIDLAKRQAEEANKLRQARLDEIERRRQAEIRERGKTHAAAGYRYFQQIQDPDQLQSAYRQWVEMAKERGLDVNGLPDVLDQDTMHKIALAGGVDPRGTPIAVHGVPMWSEAGTPVIPGTRPVDPLEVARQGALFDASIKDQLDEQKTQRRRRETGIQGLSNLAVPLQQYQRARAEFEKLRNSMVIGPGGQTLIPSAARGRYEKALAALRQSMRKLTRTKGEGAMSDLETRLAIAQLPDPADYEEAQEAAFDQIGTMLDTLTQQYQWMAGGASDQGPPAPAAPSVPQEPENLIRGEVQW